MPAIVKLGQAPKTFAPSVVHFPMPSGEDGTLRITYHYRTRKEYAAWVDSLSTQAQQRAAALQEPPAVQTSAPATEGAGQATEGAVLAAEGADPAPAAPPVTTMQHFVAGQGSQRAEFILGAVAAWDLDVPLGANTVQQLIDELPAGAQAIVNGYGAACLEGHLGN